MSMNCRRAGLYIGICKNMLKCLPLQSILSTWFLGNPSGGRCEDVQQLTYADCSFDLCSSTEVFEHVPDDEKGFSEIFRVLKPGGWVVFTVPLGQHIITVERAILATQGGIQHLRSPEYHGDPLSGTPILVFRNYGKDVCQRLLAAGFRCAKIVPPSDVLPYGIMREVIVAQR